MELLLYGLCIQRLSYITCLFVWLVAYGRRRTDLVATAIFVHVVYILDSEFTIYHRAISHGAVYYTKEDSAEWLSHLSVICANGGIAVLFIYSTGLMYILHERIASVVAWIAIIAVYSSELVDELVIGVRVTISATLFTFYVYERMTRHTIILTDPWSYKSGYSLFYTGLGLFITQSITETVSMRPLLGGVAFALVNIGTVLVLLSVPRAEKHELVIVTQKT